MYKQVERPKENKSRAVANSVPLQKSNVKQGFGFVDNRQNGVVQGISSANRRKSYVKSQPIIQRWNVRNQLGEDNYNIDLQGADFKDQIDKAIRSIEEWRANHQQDAKNKYQRIEIPISSGETTATLYLDGKSLYTIGIDISNGEIRKKFGSTEDERDMLEQNFGDEGRKLVNIETRYTDGMETDLNIESYELEQFKFSDVGQQKKTLLKLAQVVAESLRHKLISKLVTRQNTPNKNQLPIELVRSIHELVRTQWSTLTKIKGITDDSGKRKALVQAFKYRLGVSNSDQLKQVFEIQNYHGIGKEEYTVMATLLQRMANMADKKLVDREVYLKIWEEIVQGTSIGYET